MPKQDHRPRDESYDLIVDAVRRSDSPLTRTHIAHALDREKTPHLIRMVEELVDEGLLLRRIKTFNNGVQGYIYTLNPDHPQAP